MGIALEIIAVRAVCDISFWLRTTFDCVSGMPKAIFILIAMIGFDEIFVDIDVAVVVAAAATVLVHRVRAVWVTARLRRRRLALAELPEAILALPA